MNRTAELDLDRGILQTTITVSNLEARNLRGRLISAMTGNESLEMLKNIHDQMHKYIDVNSEAQIELISLEGGRYEH